MNFLFLTAQAPWGRGESFLLDEINELAAIPSMHLSVVPCNPPRELFHKSAHAVSKYAHRLPLLSVSLLAEAIKTLFVRPRAWSVLYAVAVCSVRSGGISVLLKNFAVLPKALALVSLVERRRVQHIHAYWGTTPATIGYVLSRITNVPWSFTVHRWDISENNMLKEKVKTAAFVRCISEHGRGEVRRIVGEPLIKKVRVLHLGVRVPEHAVERSTESQEVVVPGNLYEVKGHTYLVEAFALLKQRGMAVHGTMYGAGSLLPVLRAQIDKLHVADMLEIHPPVPREELLALYADGKTAMVVLPSITTERGEHEGIPVSLMEAMAYGIPVVSTETGGVPELVREEAGILVREKSQEALAEAIARVLQNPQAAKATGKRGRAIVVREFNVHENARRFLSFLKLTPVDLQDKAGEI